MKAQEEEMRQNMEEMLALQEESEAKEEELLKLYSALFNNLAIIEYNSGEKILEINKLFAELYNIDNTSEIKEKEKISTTLNIDNTEFTQILNTVKDGKTYIRFTKTKQGRRNINIKELHIAVLSDDGNIDKVICISLNLDL